MAYPDDIPTFTTPTDGTTADYDAAPESARWNASDVTAIHTALTSVMTTLGLDPAGVSATVAARLNATGGSAVYATEYLSPSRTPGTTLDTSGMLAAIAATTAGKTLVIPPGLYKVADVMAFDGLDDITVDARGAIIELVDDGTTTGRIVQASNCSGFRWYGGKIWQTAAARTGVLGLLTLDTVDEFLISALETVGGSSVSIFTKLATNGRIVAPRFADTQADGIHISRGSTDITITAPLGTNTGDDAVAVVSVTNDGGTTYAQCARIAIDSPIVRSLVGTVGSGVALVGPKDCTVTGGAVQTTPAAGVKVAGGSGFHVAAGNNITGTKVRGALNGVQLGDCTDTQVTGCSAVGCGDAGVALLGATRASIFGGNYRENGFGLYESSGTNNTANGAVLTGNTIGAYQVATATLTGCVTA